MELNTNLGVTRDLVTMATQSNIGGGWDMEHDDDDLQGTAEPNFTLQQSNSPELLSNHTQLQIRTYTSKDALPQKMVHVGALEVQNVKRAIHRYGTLPKNARIGAYLESLRQSGMANHQENNSTSLSPLISTIEHQKASEAPASINILETQQYRPLSPHQNKLRNQSQMTRSNSASGVVTTHQPPNSPRNRIVGGPPLKSNNTNNNNNNCNNNTVDSNNLKTFRVSTNAWPFRTASPPKSNQPSLVNLDFPPPPLDLPPLFNELLKSEENCDLLPPPSISPSNQSQNNSGSPCNFKNTTKSERRLKEELISNDEHDEWNIDLKTAEPSPNEASSRFGVNLRRRERDQQQQHTQQQLILLLQSESKEIDVYGQTFNRDEINPPLSSNIKNNNEAEDSKENNILGTYSSKPGMKEMLELKLINEIKKSCEIVKPSENFRRINMLNIGGHVDPASQLLSELCASCSTDIDKQNEYAVVNLGPQPRELQSIGGSSFTENTVGLGFKLKKFDKRNNSPQLREENIDGQIIDFKARLRKIDNIVDKLAPILSGFDEKSGKRLDEERTNNVDLIDCQLDEQLDDKRRSTGSISSLKKLWENKEFGNTEMTSTGFSVPVPTSPKLGINIRCSIDPTEESSEDLSGASTRSSATNKSEARLQRSSNSELEKPLVPARPVKPYCVPNKHLTSSIYAIPNCLQSGLEEDQQPSKQGLESGSRLSYNKQSMTEIASAIENSIVCFKSSSNVVIASWLQLSDKVSLLYNMCSNYTQEVTIPAHAKFYFRDVISRLESQARQLRAAGTRNITDNTKLLIELQNTIKDVCNMLQR